jgi:hypothetical protein
MGAAESLRLTRGWVKAEGRSVIWRALRAGLIQGLLSAPGVTAKIREKKSFGVRVLRKCLLTPALDSCKKAKILKPTVAHHACFFKGMFRAGDLERVETGRVRET